MKRLFSFALFITIVLLALIARNTVQAHPLMKEPGWRVVDASRNGIQSIQ